MKAHPVKHSGSFSRNELKILRSALRAAECMACLCYNAKQNDTVPEDHRKAMDETGTAFDVARRSFTKKMRLVLGETPTAK